MTLTLQRPAKRASRVHIPRPKNLRIASDAPPRVREVYVTFTPGMVRAILAGLKTVTRRLMRPQPERQGCCHLSFKGAVWQKSGDPIPFIGHRCPYGPVGTVLVVKESAWMWCERRPNGVTKTGRPKWHYVPLQGAPVHYLADHPERPTTSVVSPETGSRWGWRFKAGRFLPRWAVRTTLEVTGLGAERVQDIGHEDAVAEGCPEVEGRTWGRLGFSQLWDGIHGDGVFGWRANPWVWVVRFARRSDGVTEVRCA